MKNVLTAMFRFGSEHHDPKLDSETHGKRFDFAFVTEESKIKYVSSSNLNCRKFSLSIPSVLITSFFNNACVPDLVMFQNLLPKKPKFQA
jgi:hypothetical protein